MKQVNAFLMKEWLELTRTGRLWLMLILSVLFGVMNPAIAKLTPWMMELFSTALAQSGMTVGKVQVDALSSWMQFYKNVPLLLLLFVIVFSGILTAEYQKGTLIPLLARGMARRRVVLVKMLCLSALWSGGYWLCYGITYAYSAYYWDHSVVRMPFLAALCPYVLGLWLFALIMLGSTLFETNTAALLFTGGVFLLAYLAGMIPALAEYLPTLLLGADTLVRGEGRFADYVPALLIAAGSGALFLTAAVWRFRRKSL